MNIKIISTGSHRGNCYRIDDGETALLLDAGASIRTIQQACNFKLSEITGCLISHSHGDHIKSAVALAKFGIDIFASPETFKESKLSGFRFCPVDALKKFTVGTFKILPFDAHHDVRNYAYKISSTVTKETLIYMTDSYYTEYTFGQSQYLMIECNYSRDALNYSVEKGYIPESLKSRLLKSHMSLDNFLDLLKKNDLSKCKQIYLLHLSDNNSDEKLFKSEVERATGCEVYVA